MIHFIQVAYHNDLRLHVDSVSNDEYDITVHTLDNPSGDTILPRSTSKQALVTALTNLIASNIPTLPPAPRNYHLFEIRYINGNTTIVWEIRSATRTSYKINYLEKHYNPNIRIDPDIAQSIPELISLLKLDLEDYLGI